MSSVSFAFDEILRVAGFLVIEERCGCRIGDPDQELLQRQRDLSAALRVGLEP